MARYDEAAWASATVASTMLCEAWEIGVGREPVVRAACACLRLALVHVPAGEDRPRRAVEAAEATAWLAAAPLETWLAGAASDQYARPLEAYALSNVAYGAAYASDATRAHITADCAADAIAHATCAVATRDYRVQSCLRLACFQLEAHRRMAVLVRGHVPWDTMAAAYAANWTTRWMTRTTQR